MHIMAPAYSHPSVRYILPSGAPSPTLVGWTLTVVVGWTQSEEVTATRDLAG